MQNNRLLKLPARATVWYLGVSLITKGIGILTTPIFTRILSGEDYGSFALYMSLLGCGSVICSAVSSGSSVYKGLSKNGDDIGSYLRATLLLSLGFSALVCLVLFAFSPFFELERVFYLPLSLQLLCDGATAVLLSYAKFRYEYKTVAAVSLISAALPPVFSVILLKITDFGYTVRVFSLLFVSFAVALFSLTGIFKAALKNEGRPGTSPAMIKKAIGYTLPMLPHAISSAVTSQADKLIISSLMGAAALGKYSVVYSIGIALQFIVTAVGSALSPWMIRRLEAGESRPIARLMLPMTVGYLALSLCIIAIAPEALMILAPGEYSEAFPALLPIVLSTPLYFVQTVATVGIVHSGKTGYSLIASTTGALICLILNYTLVLQLGYLGAGLALLITQASMTVISIALLKRTNDGTMLEPLKLLLIYLSVLPLAIGLSRLSGSITARIILLIIPLMMLGYCLLKALTLVVEKGRKMGV